MNPLLGCLLLGCLIIPVQTQAQPCLEMIWSDEFDGNALDTSRWSYDIGDGCPNLCGWGNNEQQYYTDAPENIKVENGLLVITGREDNVGGAGYSSAKIKSQWKGDFRYGRFEARMKFPTTQGVWPAFWMLPTESVYGIWPESGEMDIVEMIGSNPGRAVGTVHTGFPYAYNSGYYDLPSGQIFADDFHVFAMDWEPDSITWFVDGIQYHQLTPNDIGPWAPFQEDFYLILNLALGGNWPGPVDATTVLPQSLEVDYVRVYNRPERLPIRGEQPMVEAIGLEYRTFDIAGANYIWTVPSDATITSGQGTHQITVDWGCTPGAVSLELQTDCDDAILTYEVADFVIPTLSGPGIVNKNQAGLTYTLSQASAGTFTWEVPTGAVIVSGQGSNQIVVDWGCEPGEVTVVFDSSCGTASFSDTLPVALPTYAIRGQVSLPANSSSRTYSFEEIPGATYTWSVSAGSSIVSGQGTSTIGVDFGTTDATISVEVGTSCGTDTYDFAVVIEESFLYVDFDSIDLEFIAYDGAVFEEVTNPFPSGMNMSQRVGRVNKTVGAKHYSGVEADVYEIALDLRPIMTQKVLSTTTGIVRFMLDDETTGSERLKINMDYGPDDVNKWVQLVYDFTGSPDEVYDQLRLTYNHFVTTTEFWYFDDVMSHPDLSTSISPEKGSSEVITVYPNPSSDWFYVDTKGNFPVGSTYGLEVLDVQGRSILSRQVVAQGQPVGFDLSGQPAGLYFVRLSGPSLRYVKAVSKME
ncbi:MAG: family 16 glycosylhydrolase [bacterium]|nr:family 16 glycosylhydrolase [bacterium]